MNSKKPDGVHFYYQGQCRWMVAFLAIFEVGFIVGILVSPLNYYLWIGAFICLFLSLNLSSIKVVIDDHSVYVLYGIGIFQKIMDIHTIDRMGLVGNNSIQALYHTAAPMALKIADREGRKMMVGIGETKAMLEFLQSRFRG